MRLDAPPTELLEVDASAVSAGALLFQPSKSPRTLTVVVPLLNEAESLPGLYAELSDVLGSIGLPYELIFVDDGSTDGSARVLAELYSTDRRVRVVQFRRNFGKSAALDAGFQVARGEAVITMDADLQDMPAEIPKLLDSLDAGNDLVSGWKFPRLDPLSKRLPSSVFNAVVRSMTGVPLHDFNCGFKVYRAEVVSEIHLYGELHRYVPVLAHWRGFKVAEVKVAHRPRRFGKSKFGARRFTRGFFDLLTVLFLTQYNRRPLHFFGWFGMAGLAAGFAINLYLAVLKFMGHPIGNRPLLTLGVLLMIFGALLVVFGLLAEMIAGSSTQREYSVRHDLRHHDPITPLDPLAPACDDLLDDAD